MRYRSAYAATSRSCADRCVSYWERAGHPTEWFPGARPGLVPDRSPCRPGPSELFRESSAVGGSRRARNGCAGRVLGAGSQNGPSGRRCPGERGGWGWIRAAVWRAAALGSDAPDRGTRRLGPSDGEFARGRWKHPTTSAVSNICSRAIAISSMPSCCVSAQHVLGDRAFGRWLTYQLMRKPVVHDQPLYAPPSRARSSMSAYADRRRIGVLKGSFAAPWRWRWRLGNGGARARNKRGASSGGEVAK